LQSRAAELDAGGVALFAISYDAVDVLALFAAKHGVTYPLLSDQGSAAIRSLGLLNEHVAEQQAVYGVPVRDFVLDREGVVVKTRFEQSYRHRPSATVWVEELFGTPAAAVISATAAGSGAQVTAWLDTPVYRPYQLLQLRVELRVAAGLHVYGSPIPEGYTPLTIELAPFDGLAVRPARLPQPGPLRVAGLDEQFVVHEGAIEAIVPFAIEGARGDIELTVELAYQACSATECFPPASLRLALPLACQDLIRD
jgi:hypothetical protein